MLHANISVFYPWRDDPIYSPHEKSIRNSSTYLSHLHIIKFSPPHPKCGNIVSFTKQSGKLCTLISSGLHVPHLFMSVLLYFRLAWQTERRQSFILKVLVSWLLLKPNTEPLRSTLLYGSLGRSCSCVVDGLPELDWVVGGYFGKQETCTRFSRSH